MFAVIKADEGGGKREIYSTVCVEFLFFCGSRISRLLKLYVSWDGVADVAHSVDCESTICCLNFVT